MAWCRLWPFSYIALIRMQSTFKQYLMDSNTQDQYIQKKLLYKFDKKLDTVEQEYLRQLFPSSENPRRLSNEELLQEIYALEFMNFKYRTALLSSNTDIARNQMELFSQEQSILSARKEIKELNEQLERAQIAMQNKRRYNQIGSEIRKYDKKDVFDKKKGELEAELQQLEERYSRDMKNFENKERLLKTSIAALKSFITGIDQRSDPADNAELFRGEAEDDGQIY